MKTALTKISSTSSAKRRSKFRRQMSSSTPSTTAIPISKSSATIPRSSSTTTWRTSSSTSCSTSTGIRSSATAATRCSTCGRAFPSCSCTIRPRRRRAASITPWAAPCRRAAARSPSARASTRVAQGRVSALIFRIPFPRPSVRGMAVRRRAIPCRRQIKRSLSSRKRRAMSILMKTTRVRVII